MIPIDLITGFLGAGKTTFLLRYARWLQDQGLSVGVLVYDHGAANVDLPLLRSLRSERCEIETLAGGCGADCHRRRFRTRLIAMAMAGYDRVLIEPSGVFDMDEFFDTINEPPLDRRYEAGSVIAVVDAKLSDRATPEEDFFLASQAANAGCVVLSRCQLASQEEIAGALSHLGRAAEAIRCRPMPGGNVLAKDWDALTDADFRMLMNCGWRTADYEKRIAGREGEFQSLSFLDLPLDGAALLEKAGTLFHDASLGHVLRVKGFYEEAGQWYQFNATADEIRTEPVPESRAALLVIGSALNEDGINLLLTGRRPEHHIL